MAKVHGRSSVVKIGGTTICATSKGFTLTRDIAEATNDCDTQKEFLDGLEDHTMQAQGNQEVGSGATVNTLFTAYDAGGDLAWYISTTGSATPAADNPIWEGTGRMRSLSLDFPISGPATYNAQFQGVSQVTMDITP